MAYVICFDTICDGFQPVIGLKGNPNKYATKKAAEKEIASDPKFYDDCFVTHEREIGHKTIYTGANHG